jgi:glutaredoxin
VKRALLALCLLVCAASCKSKDDAAAEPTAIQVRDDRTDLLFVWIDESGDTHVETTIAGVPADHRDIVRVMDPSVQATSDRVVLVTLGTKLPDGGYATRVAPRDEFENVAMTRRKEHGVAVVPSSGAARTAAAAAADQGTARPAVIIYGAEWCGPCHQAAAYLRQRGIQYVEKDIEKDQAASQEMRAKLRAAGLSGGSIPVIDVRGRVLQGFSASAIESALGKGA